MGTQRGEDGHKVLRKTHRKELTLLQIAEMFRDEDAAQDRIASQSRPEGPYCESPQGFPESVLFSNEK